jgi:uncharacterized paraquat-inducible protein A
MKSERYEPKPYIESANESCHYCHNTTLQQVVNEKVCARCGTRVYITAGLNPLKLNSASVSLTLATT